MNGQQRLGVPLPGDAQPQGRRRLLPSDVWQGSIAVVRLGAGVGGTKAKRKQFAILRLSELPDVFKILPNLVVATVGGITRFLPSVCF